MAKPLYLIKPIEVYTPMVWWYTPHKCGNDIHAKAWWYTKPIGLNKKIQVRRLGFFGPSDRTWTCSRKQPSLPAAKSGECPHSLAKICRGKFYATARGWRIKRPQVQGANQKIKNRATEVALFFMVRVTGLEPAASWPPVKRATTCATPGWC